MYTCPHCAKPALSIARKIFLGPGAPFECLSCRQSVRITFPDWLKAALPGATVMISALFFDSDMVMYGLSAIGLALMIGLHLLWVPLVKD
ncbi:MAG: hypothetical protein OEY27_05470 [Gammaproteobacteria bacterium]|nr:hypothetical protein [Gammaproteobacteria bacterium]